MSKRTRASHRWAACLSTAVLTGCTLFATAAPAAAQIELGVEVSPVAVVPVVIAPGVPVPIVGPSIPLNNEQAPAAPQVPAPAVPQIPNNSGSGQAATPNGDSHQQNPPQYPEATVPRGAQHPTSETPHSSTEPSTSSSATSSTSTSSTSTSSNGSESATAATAAESAKEKSLRENFISSNPDAFVFTVDTRLTGDSSKSFSMSAPGVGDAEPHFKVTCDIANPSNSFKVDKPNDSAACNYDNPGEYTIGIQGAIPRLQLGFSGGRPQTTDALLRVDSWGTNQWRSMEGMFQRATNVQFTPYAGAPDLNKVRSTAYMFDGATRFDSDIAAWNTNSVTSMAGMFNKAQAFNGDISGWDTSNVTEMHSMFAHAKTFSADISSWDTSKVQDMTAMFDGATDFDINLRTWNVGSLTKANNIFDHSGLSPINYSSTLDGWVRSEKAPRNLTIGAEGVYWCPHPSFDEAKTLMNERGWVRNDAGAASEYQGPVISVVNKQDLDSEKKGPVTIVITTDEPLRGISSEWKEVAGKKNTYSRVFDKDETTTVKAWDNFGNPSLAMITVSGFDIAPTSLADDNTAESRSLRYATISAFSLLVLLLGVFAAYVVHDRRRTRKDAAYRRLKELQSSATNNTP